MRATLRDLCASKRLEDGEGDERFSSLCAEMVAEEDGEVILSVGGRWDKRDKRYDGDADQAVVLGLHPGQIEPARWFARWCEARLRGETLSVSVVDADGRGQSKRPVYSCLCAGGRRGGKTDFCVKCALCFCVLIPGSRVWLVSENIPKTEELDEVLLDLLPSGWYARLGAPWYRYTFLNGSSLHLRSAHDAESLKRGRCDFAVLNEAQNIPERAYAIVRAAIADTGGLVLLAANPPDNTPLGQWVGDFYERTKARRRASKLFEFDPRLNPHVRVEALESMADEIDERSFRIEILGEFLPRTDVVFYSWSQDNVVPLPEMGRIVTGEFLRRRMGSRPFPRVIGADFQMAPHMAAVSYQAYDDPLDPFDQGGEPLLWIAEEFRLEGATEDDLIDELEARGFRGDETAVIADASGEWQDAERTRGKGSYDRFRERKWRFIFTPDKDTKRNPLIIERTSVANSRMRAADGRRRLFSAPENYHTNRALKLWEIKNGFPNKRSEHAHLSDAVTYPLYRWYPRKLRSKVEYKGLGARGASMEGGRRGGGRRGDFDGI